MFLIWIVLGIIVIILGIIILAAKAASLVSMSSHVKDENKRAFTTLSGISTIGIGIAMIFTGFSNYILFTLIFIVSMFLYAFTQWKYNRG